MNSGFLSDTDIINGMDVDFSDIEIISQSSSHFIAQSTRYGRRWLLKGLRPEVADDPLLRQQLFKEFRILSMVSHPGVVSFAGVEEVGTLGLCIVMEWIEGTTLEDALREGSLTKADRLKLLLEITDAVAYLHSIGIVHRDLKPSNIMVRRNGGTAVVIDFGLADTDAFTIVKYPAGTLGYASERQQHASTPDTSDDIYSLGMIMRLLYPEYGAIARRCLAGDGKRYRDASKLSQTLRRRKRLMPRVATAAISILSVAAIIALGVMAYHNNILRSNVDSLGGKMSELREENQRELTAASRQRELLSDSMNNVTNRLTEESALQRARMNDSITYLQSRLEVESAFRKEQLDHQAYINDLKSQLSSRLVAVKAKHVRLKGDSLNKDLDALSKFAQELYQVRDNFIESHKKLTESDLAELKEVYEKYYNDNVLVIMQKTPELFERKRKRK